MANISLTQKAAKALRVDIKHLEPLASANSDDWLVTDLWDSKKDTWLFFMHKQSMMCFVVNPNKYKMNEAISGLLFVIHRYLDDSGLLHKYHYFEESLKSINLYKNSDAKATANINKRRTEIYYRQYTVLNDEHLNYVLNAHVQATLCKVQATKKEYAVMHESFNEYLQQIPSYGVSSVKKPDYCVIEHIGNNDFMVPITNTVYQKDLGKYFSVPLKEIEINAFCGIAFGLMILSDGLSGALKAVKNLASSFESNSIFCNKKYIELLLIDLVNSYSHIMSYNPNMMYLIEAGVPYPLNEASENGIFYFSLGLYYTIFMLFKFELQHKNHPIVMERQDSFNKIEEFLHSESSLDNDRYIKELPTIINELYLMHRQAITLPAETIH